MKFSVIIFGLLLASFSSALPKANPADGMFDGIIEGLGDKFKDAAKRNVAKMCMGSGGGIGIDSCPKPFQYCDTRLILSTRCRYTAGTWFLMVGLPIIAIGLIIGVAYYMKNK